uniref:WD_REPEATS_REGION domain-containing protein n=1 Tax=Caenorhabditis tropicalis TaxID=1561998 RepID=A0A1I7TMC4_9PELO
MADSIFSKSTESIIDHDEGKKEHTEPPMSTIHHAAVALEHTGFSIGDQNGIKLFQLFPLNYRMYKNYVPKVGSVRIVKHMGLSNRLVYVSAPDGKFPQNTAIVFDIEGNKDWREVTTPSRYGAITNVHVSQNRLVVFTGTRMFVFKFPDNIEQIRAEDIGPNPNGISAMSYDPTTTSCYIAYPGFKTGSVQIMNLNTLTARESKSPVVIEAHLTEITQIALNCQGTLIATGSTKGTVVRVFDARTKGLLYELRRGTVPAHLQCLAFSPCSCYLAVASDKGTLHLFGIRDAEPQKKMNVLERNRGSSSILKIQLDRKVLALGFSKPTETPKSFMGLVAICSDASYWRYHFTKDSNGKYMHLPPVYEKLIDFAEEASFFRVNVE